MVTPPRFCDAAGFRQHYVDEGPGEGHGRPVLLLHGQPTWGYVWRRFIPPLATTHRVVVPDPELTRARLELCRAARNTLRIALGLMGVSAPERM